MSFQDATKDLVIVEGSRATFEQAMMDALTSDAQYPHEAGVGLLQSLGWEKGYEAILASTPELTRLDMSDWTWPLLPELVPVPPGFGGGWLDRRCPHYRTLGRTVPVAASRVSDYSLAVLYEDIHEFADLAYRIQSKLAAPGFKVTLFNGSAWGENPVRWQPTLEEIFRRYRAVVFLGHLFRPNPSAEQGWELSPATEERAAISLPMPRVRNILTPPRGDGKFTFSLPVPEVIFPACCAGAWQSPGEPGERPLAYPKMFLDCGVRHFVGTWMDVFGPLAAQGESLGVLEGLIVGFFRRWAHDPGKAVYHLYQAKSRCCRRRSAG